MYKGSYDRDVNSTIAASIGKPISLTAFYHVADDQGTCAVSKVLFQRGMTPQGQGRIILRREDLEIIMQPSEHTFPVTQVKCGKSGRLMYKGSNVLSGTRVLVENGGILRVRVFDLDSNEGNDHYRIGEVYRNREGLILRQGFLFRERELSIIADFAGDILT